MSNTLVPTNSFANRAASLEASRSELEAPRQAHADEAKAQLQIARAHGQDTASYYSNSAHTAWYGIKNGAMSTAVGAVAAAQTGAAVGFAAVGGIAKGASTIGRTVLGGFARGFLALSNVLARSLGEQPATRAPSTALKAPSFAERMFAKAKQRWGSAQALGAASRAGFADAARVGVIGTAANATLGTVASARAAGRFAIGGWHSAAAASYRGAQATLAFGRAAVTTAESAARATRDATLRAAASSAAAAGGTIVG